VALIRSDRPRHPPPPPLHQRPASSPSTSPTSPPPSTTPAASSCSRPPSLTSSDGALGPLLVDSQGRVPRLVEGPTPRQTNGYGCGVYVMAVAKAICIRILEIKRLRSSCPDTRTPLDSILELTDPDGCLMALTCLLD
jgi:hypothetical protein